MPATLEQVRTVIEIVPGGSATPIKRFMMAARTGTLAAILTNQAEIQTADLPPGRYTASATPMIGEQALGRVSRVFEIVDRYDRSVKLNTLSGVDPGRFVARAIDVLDVRARIGVRMRVDAGFAAELEHAAAEAAQERAIVRHEDHRPLERLQRIDQHFLGRQIEVVGRLVEDQEVRRIEQHPRHRQARFLAARQRADLLVDVVA